MIDGKAGRDTPLPDLPSDAGLLDQALSAEDEDAYWDAVSLLQDRATREVFGAAVHLTESNTPRERALGVDILAQGRSGMKSFHEETMEILLTLLERDDNAAVLTSIGHALGHREDPRGIDLTLAKLSRHPDSEVRYAAVLALIDWWEDPRVLHTLMELSGDHHARVRDWATFGLGSICTADTTEIREALLARLEDEDSDTRGEAITGLAKRHDNRALDSLIQDLRDGWIGPSYGNAILALAGPDLLPTLEQIRDRWQEAGYSLDGEIRKCQAQPTE